MSKNLLAKMEPLLDFVIAHCTALSLLYSKLTFKMLKPDKRLASLKDKYLGASCFVVALGPSLKTEDLDMIEDSGMFSFSMNHCFHLFNKTKWRPDCYFISDGRLDTPDVQNAMKDMAAEGTLIVYSRREVKHVPENSVYYKADYIDFIRSNSAKKKYREASYACRFSTDAYDRVYSAHSCVTSIIQVAYYMGFRKIYLIGQDCGTSAKLDHSDGIKAPVNPHQADDLKKVIIDFDEQWKFIKENGIALEIVNCTRGGCLEVFPRQSLEDVLGL